jgi:hypothetical protein
MVELNSEENSTKPQAKEEHTAISSDKTQGETTRERPTSNMAESHQPNLNDKLFHNVLEFPKTNNLLN